jgi:Helix-turn-helix domain
MSADNRILDNGDERKYFALIPNMIDEMGLSPYAVRLYLHIKRRTGEVPGGVCFETSSNIAKICKMSTGSVSNAKKELRAAGLITIAQRKRGHGEFDGHDITINDIWAVNILKYTASSSGEQEGSTHESDGSSGETKKNPIKKKPAEEDISAATSFSENENLYLHVIGLMFGKAYETYQKELMRLYRKVNDEKLLMDVFIYYANMSCYLTDGLIVRIERAIKRGWNMEHAGNTCSEWEAYLHSIGIKSIEDAEAWMERRREHDNQSRQQ